MKTLFLYIVSGFLAGFVNGLFGTGGGIILVFLFAYLSYPAHKIFATTNITVLFLSLVSFFFYIDEGNISSQFLPHILPALAGGALGSLFLAKIKGSFLKKLFSVIVIIGAAGRLLK